MVLEVGAGEEADIARAAEDAHGLGLFVRSLVGLDREAATEAFSGFLADTTFTVDQIRFVNLIVGTSDGQRRDGGSPTLRVAVHRSCPARSGHDLS